MLASSPNGTDIKVGWYDVSAGTHDPEILILDSPIEGLSDQNLFEIVMSNPERTPSQELWLLALSAVRDYPSYEADGMSVDSSGLWVGGNILSGKSPMYHQAEPAPKTFDHKFAKFGLSNDGAIIMYTNIFNNLVDEYGLEDEALTFWLPPLAEQRPVVYYDKASLGILSIDQVLGVNESLRDWLTDAMPRRPFRKFALKLVQIAHSDEAGNLVVKPELKDMLTEEELASLQAQNSLVVEAEAELERAEALAATILEDLGSRALDQRRTFYDTQRQIADRLTYLRWLQHQQSKTS